MRAAHSNYRLGLGCAYRPWNHLRRARALGNSRRALGPIARAQLVAGLAADSKPLAQLRHVLCSPQQRPDKLHLLVHGTDLSPRHRIHLLPCLFNLLTMLPVYSVTDPAGLYPFWASPCARRGLGRGAVVALRNPLEEPVPQRNSDEPLPPLAMLAATSPGSKEMLEDARRM